MEKLSSKRKSDNNFALSKSQADEIIDVVANYISDWTQKELIQIADTKKFPVCWPLKSGGFRIGNEIILPEQHTWRRYDRNHEQKQLFGDKVSAFLYSLLKQMGHLDISHRIEMLDRDLLKLRNDIYNYEYCYKQSLKNKDDFNITVYSSRLNNARLQYKFTKDRLQKSIISAKYLKVWDQSLCS